MILHSHPKSSGTLLKLAGTNLGPLWKMILLFLFLTIYYSSGQVAEVEIVYGIGIKMCKLICIEKGSCSSIAYNIDKLACHLSHKTARDWTEKEAYTLFLKQGNQIPEGACTLMTCKVNTQCVERRRGGTVCVEDKTVTSALESECVTRWDCPEDGNFVCSIQTCKCEEGYTFNPTNNSCVRDKTATSALESECVTRWDCPEDGNFVCSIQTCKCEEGYTFNPTNNSCVRDSTVSKALELACRSNSDCQTAEKFVCFNQLCRCDPGYHFNPSNNSCVRRCNAYGHGFTIYQGLSITGRNNKEIYSLMEFDCHESCTEESSYNCITCEFNLFSHLCLLSQYGYLDVPASDREDNGWTWNFSVRQCA